MQGECVEQKRPRGRQEGFKPRQHRWIIGEVEYDVPIPPPPKRGRNNGYHHPDRIAELQIILRDDTRPPTVIAKELHTKQPRYFCFFRRCFFIVAL